jgi:hypothetical protein
LAISPQEQETLVGDLETRVDRLRVLYEQYFLGFEKLEPTIARKEVERRLDVLRKENIRNTGLRFRFQRILQKYNTYQTYWTRICRQIEEGTFKRHVRKANQRSGDPRKRAEVELDSVEVDLDDLEAMSEDEIAELTRGTPSAERGTPADDEDDALDTLRPPPPLPPETGSMFDTLDAFDAFDALESLERAPGSSPGSRDAPSSNFLRTRVGPGAMALAPPAVPGQPTTHRGTSAALPPGAKPRVVVRKANDAAMPNAPAPSTRSLPAAPPAPSQRSMPAAQPAAAGPTRRASNRAMKAHGAPPAAQKPAAGSKAGDLSDDRIRQLYSSYIEAKRANRESTAAITFDSLARSLRESSAKLKEKHSGKNVDFEVTVKDGKTILRPVVK